MKNFKEHLNEAEYQGKKVTLNKPVRAPKGDDKKFHVYVKNEKGNVIKLGFGDPNMDIKRDDPGRFKSFRARFQCDTDPGPKWKAKYWSCKFWEPGKTVTDLLDDVELDEDVLNEAPFAIDTIQYGKNPGMFDKAKWKFDFKMPVRSASLSFVDDGEFTFAGTYRRAIKELIKYLKQTKGGNLKQTKVELKP